VAITGTNGKSTTTALVAHVLTHAGKDARMGGNIGVPVLGLAPLHAGAIYVLELSSFQLELVDSLRADAAIWLNTTPDHLDRHGDMAGYVAAKARVFRNQGAGDWAIIGVDDLIGSHQCTQLTARAAQTVCPISAGQALGRGVCAIGRQVFEVLSTRAEAVLDLDAAPALPGRHNAQNIAAAYAACRALGLDARTIAAGIASFPGLAHRLERVATIDGVRFINDSKATNADAAAQALAVYPRVWWIAGGRAKQGGIESLDAFFPRIARAFLIGEAAEDFAKTLHAKAPTQMSGDLETAVRQAFGAAKGSGEPHPVVLFSPACASFDQFADFEARGDAFKAIVAKLPELGAIEPQRRAGPV
jgi:UDP-N-acetylmuramoylalanine--D-glutamate ligase